MAKNVTRGRVWPKKNVMRGGSVLGEGGDRGYPTDKNGIALRVFKVSMSFNLYFTVMVSKW